MGPEGSCKAICNGLRSSLSFVPQKHSSTKACKFHLSFRCHPLAWVQEDQTPLGRTPPVVRARPLPSPALTSPLLPASTAESSSPGTAFRDSVLLAPCCHLIWSRQLCQASRSSISGPTPPTSGPADCLNTVCAQVHSCPGPAVCSMSSPTFALSHTWAISCRKSS